MVYVPQNYLKGHPLKMTASTGEHLASGADEASSHWEIPWPRRNSEKTSSSSGPHVICSFLNTHSFKGSKENGQEQVMRAHAFLSSTEPSRGDRVSVGQCVWRGGGRARAVRPRSSRALFLGALPGSPSGAPSASLCRLFSIVCRTKNLTLTCINGVWGNLRWLEERTIKT